MKYLAISLIVILGLSSSYLLGHATAPRASKPLTVVDDAGVERVMIGVVGDETVFRLRDAQGKSRVSFRVQPTKTGCDVTSATGKLRFTIREEADDVVQLVLCDEAGSDRIFLSTWSEYSLVSLKDPLDRSVAEAFVRPDGVRFVLPFDAGEPKLEPYRGKKSILFPTVPGEAPKPQAPAPDAVPSKVPAGAPR